MRNTIWQKRIPTLLGLLFILVGVGLTSYLVKTGVIYVGRASPSNEPRNVRITNISDTSLSVSYTTDTKVLGSISYGKDITYGKTAIDDRDQQAGTATTHLLHHITIRDLKPNTRYVFSVISGQDTFLNNDQPFIVTTATTLGTPPTQQNPLVGKTATVSNNPPQEAIVYIKTTDSQTLSTIIKSDGSYLLPINGMRTQTLSSFINILGTQSLQLLIVGDSANSEVTILASQINPVPLVILSNNYDFTVNNTPNPKIASDSALATFPILSVKQVSDQKPQIISPAKDSSYTDQQPNFQGVASPGASVKIEIHSDNAITTEVVSDPNGNWSFRPSEKLAPGQHTVAITTRDQFGILQTITHAFNVYAEGTQVDGSATPSATPILTSTPIPTPSPTNLVVGTPTPTLESTPTVIMTSSPIPTRSPIPPTGSFSLTTVGIIAISITLFGMTLFLIGRGNTV